MESRLLVVGSIFDDVVLKVFSLCMAANLAVVGSLWSLVIAFSAQESSRVISRVGVVDLLGCFAVCRAKQFILAGFQPAGPLFDDVK